VKEEIAYVGPERQDRYEHYDWNHHVAAIVGTGLQRSAIPAGALRTAERRQVERILLRLGLLHLAARRFLSLSYGERRLVLLARAIAWRPRLLLLDELLGGLDVTNRERALRLVDSLRSSRLPWVLSAHRPEDVPQSTTHLCRLERGRIVRRERYHRQRARVSSPRPARARRPRCPAEVLLALDRASVWLDGTAVLRGVSLEIRRGDCWVVHGANGSGKSTLLRTLYGDLGVARGGAIYRRGIEPGVPLLDFKRHVGFIAPELQAAHPHYLHADEVVASGLHASIGLNGALGTSERARARRALRTVGAAGLARRNLRALSYGQLRRILFARALVHTPDILLLDEPYAGLDTRTRAALTRRTDRALQRGSTIVLATHHRDEWPAATTHELELVRGRVRYSGVLRTR
ncbi:MAG: ATP-binding cassette domain-containing protein, partial [Steroidobacterales bacterium]